jgi:hypothetical protein
LRSAIARRLILSVVWLATAGSAPAFAQETGSSLYVGFRDPECFFTRPQCGAPGKLLHLDPDNRRVVQDWGLSALTGNVVYATPDGGFLLGARSRDTTPFGTQSVTALNLKTGQALPETLTETVGGLAGHPSEPEAYVLIGRRVTAVTPDGSRSMASPAGCEPYLIGPISANGVRLLLGCAGMPGGVAVYDLEREATLLQRPGFAGTSALSPDGRALYLFEDAPRAVLRKYDVDSGAMLAEREMAHQGWIYVDPFTARVFVVGDNRITMPDDGTLVLDADSLVTVRSIGREIGTYWTFDPERPRAFVVVADRESLTTSRNRLNVLNTDTLTITASWELPSSLTPLGLSLIPRPAAPVGLAATIGGNRVRLTWRAGPRGKSIQYLIEAGSMPGNADLAVFNTGSDRSAVEFAAVPAGRYFVRVRGVNANGAGLPSAEIVVAVGIGSP